MADTARAAMPCPHCKGMHDETFCPLKLRANALYRFSALGKESFQGSAPAPFIGRYGYPDVNVGILSLPERTEDSWLYDAPLEWSRQSLSIPQIVGFRSSLLNSRTKADVRQPNRVVEISQDVAMADSPVDVEVELAKAPSMRLITDSAMAPTGPAALLKHVELASNPSIPTRVQRAFDADDWKAQDAMTDLYAHGFDEHELTKLLSTGTLGVKEQRKLVPTRWSITATDDILGKAVLEQVRECPVADYQAFFGTYLGNYYLILMMPEPWRYELFELYVPAFLAGKEQYSTDYEEFSGRTSYAENCVGGYYSVRLAVAEALRRMKRQAGVLVLRFITDEYTLPLGVWVTREASRKALSKAPLKFASKELLLQFAKRVGLRFNIDVTPILGKSKLLHTKQTSLWAF